MSRYAKTLEYILFKLSFLKDNDINLKNVQDIVETQLEQAKDKKRIYNYSVFVKKYVDINKKCVIFNIKISIELSFNEKIKVEEIVFEYNTNKGE